MMESVDVMMPNQIKKLYNNIFYGMMFGTETFREESGLKSISIHCAKR
jgi:hypothetical protein